MVGQKIVIGATSLLSHTVKKMKNHCKTIQSKWQVVIAFGLVFAISLTGCGLQPESKPSTEKIPVFGEQAFTLPDRGADRVTWSGYNDKSSQDVLKSDMLPAEMRSTNPNHLYTTGDPVTDIFVQQAIKLANREEAVLKLQILQYPGIDPIITHAIESALSMMSKLISSWDDMKPTLLFITSEDEKAEDWLKLIAEKEGCKLPPEWYPFRAEEMPGSVPIKNMCTDNKKVWILNISQFTRNTPNNDLTAVMRTVTDDLFDQWEFQRRPEMQSTNKEPQWLLQGSQQLPFILYLASRTGEVELYVLPQECRETTLMAYDFEKFTPNQKTSCTHLLGRMATILLVARVGIEPVVSYFTSPTKKSFEERFKDLAGEEYEAFSERLTRWVLLRADTENNQSQTTANTYKALGAVLR